MPKMSNRAAVAALLLAASTAAFAQNYSISGTVATDDGSNPAGTKVVACPVPYQDCDTKAVEAAVKSDGSYVLRLPNAGPYQVVAWKDVDGNGDSSAGDYVGLLRGGNAITAPEVVEQTRIARLEGGAVSTASSSNADVPQLAGTWSQASNSQELVIAPKIKLQAAMATGYGTNLGGTFGPGSATNTTIVTEATPMKVKRNMTLAIKKDGTFRWVITKVQPDGKSCTKTIQQEKLGRVATSGGKITFATTGGTDSWRSSCGKSGSGAMRTMNETYDYTRSGNTMTVKGSGGVNWTFRRG